MPCLRSHEVTLMELILKLGPSREASMLCRWIFKACKVLQQVMLGPLASEIVDLEAWNAFVRPVGVHFAG